MGKVAIVSCYFQKNYGSVLQAYALQKILDDWGIENETINISGIQKEINSIKLKYYIKKLTNYEVVIEKFGYIKLYIYSKVLKNQLGKNIALRNSMFEEFNKKFCLSKPYETRNELSKACFNYTAVIVGSDQLWLPSNIEADYYTLNWVPDEVTKISYATSFGVSSLPKKYVMLSKTFLKRINYLSVREKSGQKLIHDVAGLDAPIVCDPTLLFTAEEWMCIQNPKPFIEGKYIFCYFLGDNLNHKEFSIKLKAETGYKIVALQHLDVYAKSYVGFADITPYNVGPEDFVNLIKNAEYVCTDSFHGTVFSMLNQKKFFTFRRFKEKSSLSTNTRINSLLSLVDLKERQLSADEDVKKCMEMKIDYDRINKRINAIREESKAFLRNSLRVGKKMYDKDQK